MLYTEETRSTLSFATRAKLVKTNAQVNEVVDPKTMIRRLQRELLELRRGGESQKTRHLSKQVEALQEELSQRNQRIKHLNESKMIADSSKRCPKRQRYSLPSVTSDAASPNSKKPDLKKSKTNPRRSLEAKLPLDELVNPEAEVSLFRDALVLKGKQIQDIERSQNDNARLLGAALSDLEAVKQSKSLLEVANSELVERSQAETQTLKGKLAENEECFKKRLEEKVCELQSVKEQLEDASQLRLAGEEETESLNRDKLHLEKELSDLRVQLDSQTTESTRLAVAVEELTTTNGSLLEKAETLSSLVATKDSDISTTAERLQTELAARQEDATMIASMTKENRELRDSLDAFQKSSSETEATLRLRIEEEKDRNQNLVMEFNEEKENLGGLLQAKDAEATELKHQVAEFENKNMALKKELYTFKEKSEVETTAATKLKEELSNSDSLVAELRQQLRIASDEGRAFEERIADLTKSLTHSEDKSRNLSVALESNENARNESDQAHLADVERIRQERETEESRLKAHIASLEAQLDDSAVQRENAWKECEQVKVRLVVLENDLTQSTDRCKSLSNALEACEETLMSTEEAFKAETTKKQLERETEVCRLREELSSLKTKLLEAEDLIEVQSEQCDTAKGRTQMIESELLSVRDELDHVKEERHSAMNELDAVSVTLESTKKQKEELAALSVELETKLDQTIADVEIREQETTASTAALQSKLDDQTEAYSLCLQSLTEKEEEIASLTAELEAKKLRFTELETESTIVSDHAKKAETDCASLRAMLDESAKELCNAKTEFDALSVALESTKKQNEELSARSDGLEMKLDQSVASTTSLQSKLDDQTEANSLCLASLKEKEEKIASLTTELETTKHHFTELQASSKMTKESISDLEGSLMAYQAEVDHLKGENSELQSRHKAALADSQSTLSALEESLSVEQKTKQDEIEKFIAESAVLRQTITDLELNLDRNSSEFQLLHDRFEMESEKSAALVDELESLRTEVQDLITKNQSLESSGAKADVMTKRLIQIRCESKTKIEGLTVALQTSMAQYDALYEVKNALALEFSLVREAKDQEAKRLEDMVKEALAENSRLSTMAKQLEDDARDGWLQKTEGMAIEATAIASKLEEKSNALEKASATISQLELDAKAVASQCEKAESSLLDANTQLDRYANTITELQSEVEMCRGKLSQQESNMVDSMAFSRDLEHLQEENRALVLSKSDLLTDIDELREALAEAKRGEANSKDAASIASRRCHDVHSELESARELISSLQKQRATDLAQRTASVSKTMYDNVLRKLEGTSTELQQATKEVELLRRAQEQRSKESKVCENCVRHECSLSRLNTSLAQLTEAAQQNERAQSKEIEELQAERRSGESEVTRLRKLLAEQEKCWLPPTEAETLGLRLAEQEKKLKAKNERIKKLEQHKMTKSDRIAIQKMRVRGNQDRLALLTHTFFCLFTGPLSRNGKQAQGCGKRTLKSKRRWTVGPGGRFSSDKRCSIALRETSHRDTTSEEYFAMSAPGRRARQLGSSYDVERAFSSHRYEQHRCY